MGEPSPTETRQLADEARGRVRFEEEALELADQVYQVARRLVGSREEAEDLMQDTYARAFRSWRSYQPGTNLRAWLLRILTNLNIDRARARQRRPQTEHGKVTARHEQTAARRGPAAITQIDAEVAVRSETGEDRLDALQVPEHGIAEHRLASTHAAAGRRAGPWPWRYEIHKLAWLWYGQRLEEQSVE